MFNAEFTELGGLGRIRQSESGMELPRQNQ